ncbi:serine carboxypeptidase s28 domain-containing protein [Ditylenchus destructor]|uniref:Serine carboxypeptidase s28 domain-containing protein n=1 Tax=Ditylenchus destructor TaxID=166010 RepID=A0AAD4NKE1_9BILA|nr:serine carboxypeptidase s28 domain-containing protein [Ditylenchus destructor]
MTGFKYSDGWNQRPLSIVLLVIALCFAEAESGDINYAIDYHPNMPVDHFGFSTAEIFPLRYLYNITNYKSGGPILFYPGNDAPITDFAKSVALLWDISKEMNAAVLFAEHRYYSDKRDNIPFGNALIQNVSTMGYLTVAQTLADYAQLIPAVKTKLELQQNTTVVVIGGSYGGVLAALLRLKYPSLFNAAWVSSAPVLYFRGGGIPLNGFDATVSKALEMSGCTKEVFIQSFKHLDQLFKDDKDAINRVFKLEGTNQVNTEADLSDLKAFIREAFETVAQSNYPYPAKFLGPNGLPAWPLDAMCVYFANASENAIAAAQALYNVTKLFYGNGPYCIKPENCPPDENNAFFGTKPLQQCTDLVIQLCASGPKSDANDDDWFWKECEDEASFDAYAKAGYNSRLLRPDIVRDLYGFDYSETTRIIFSDGNLDPWSAGSITAKVLNGDQDFISDSMDRSVYYFWIEGAAHHLDLRQPNTCDQPPVVNARYQIIEILKCWTGVSKAAKCNDPSSLQRELPPRGPKILGNCTSVFNAYPWGQTDEGIDSPPSAPLPQTTPSSSVSNSYVLSFAIIIVNLIGSLFCRIIYER